MLTIISVGKDHDPMFRGAIEHYEKRIAMYSKLQWKIISSSGLPEQKARSVESAQILAGIKESDYVLLLDEKGTALSSLEIAKKFDQVRGVGKKIIVVIGGAYGVDEQIIRRADATLSFGKAVFPHQLIRVMALEQIYRAFSINAGSAYHHK